MVALAGVADAIQCNRIHIRMDNCRVPCVNYPITMTDRAIDITAYVMGAVCAAFAIASVVSLWVFFL
jgi:hypothetical protein